MSLGMKTNLYHIKCVRRNSTYLNFKTQRQCSSTAACVFFYSDKKSTCQNVSTQQHAKRFDSKSSGLSFTTTSAFSQNKTKKPPPSSYAFIYFRLVFIANSNNRENMKSDLWGLDLLTPVFHSGNHGSNCFWGVPDPFTLHSAFRRQKHGLYLTHVLFSSPFMSEQSLRWCLFGVDFAFEFETPGWGGIDLKDRVVLYLLSGAFISRSTHFNKNIFTNAIFSPHIISKI